MTKAVIRESGGENFYGSAENRASSDFPQSISNKHLAS
jgi:hypothetical protein